MIQRPPDWVSAHRECRFAYTFKKHTIFGTGNFGGYMSVVTLTAFPFYINPGDRLYIHTHHPADAPFQGFHIVREVSGIHIITETPYTTAIYDICEVSHIQLPEVHLYKGYAPAELVLPVFPGTPVDLATIQPRQHVATFKPEAGPDGNIDFDISGYLKTVIEQPYKAGYNNTETTHHYPLFFVFDYIPLNYNKVEVLIKEPEGPLQPHPTPGLECTLYAANASVTTPELNRHFVDTGRPLTPLIMPAVFDKGINHYDLISSNIQLRVKL